VHDNNLKNIPPMPTPPVLERYVGSWRTIYSWEPVPTEIASEGTYEWLAPISQISKSPDHSAVVVRFKSLEHKAERYVPVNLHFDQLEAVHPFEIQYEVWMSNFPEIVRGQLNAQIRVGTS